MPGGRLWGFVGALGASWVPLGRVLGGLGVVLGGLWVLLGGVLGVLEAVDGLSADPGVREG